MNEQMNEQKNEGIYFIDRRDKNLEKFMEIENGLAFRSVINTELVFINSCIYLQNHVLCTQNCTWYREEKNRKRYLALTAS